MLGTPGVASPNAKHLALATNLPGWGKSSVLDRLHEMFGDVVLENDVNLATIAEQRFGHGQGVEDFVVVSIGTGVGMGLVLGGKSLPWRVRCCRRDRLPADRWAGVP